LQINQPSRSYIIKFNIIFLVLSFLLSLTSHAQETNPWTPPLDIPIQLSGTFGELRNNHFHAGLDIRTQGRQGLEVKSVLSGKIKRIRVSTSGYGKALYVQHFDGTTTVYAHLKKFAPKIEAYVKAKQYQKESFTLQLFPKDDELDIEQGELIGYSGNTGGSSGPHLHFEIRDSKDQSPLNPMQYPLSIQDTQRPQIQNFYLYSSADNYQAKKEYPLNKKNDSVYTTAAIEAAFEDSKSINLIIDYKNLKQNRKRIQRFAKHPESKFTFLKESPMDGTLELTPNKSYQLLIRVSDYNGNATYVEAYLSGTEAPKAISNSTFNTIDPIKDYLFDFDSTSVYFPKKAFFQKADIQVEYTGDTLRVGKDIVPLKNPYEISFTIPKMDSLEREQSFIGKLDRKGKPYFVSSKIEDNKWIAKSKTLGDFIISRDSISPKIVPLNFKNKHWLSNYSYLKFKITDDYSGIKSYRGEINGKWILLEHEPKNNTLIYDFDDLKFDEALHQLNIEAEDFAGNKTNFSADFYRK